MSASLVSWESVTGRSSFSSPGLSRVQRAIKAATKNVTTTIASHKISKYSVDRATSDGILGELKIT